MLSCILGCNLFMRVLYLASWGVTIDEGSVENTVKPLNRGHFGDGSFVPCREVVLFSEVLF